MTKLNQLAHGWVPDAFMDIYNIAWEYRIHRRSDGLYRVCMTHGIVQIYAEGRTQEEAVMVARDLLYSWDCTISDDYHFPEFWKHLS